MGEVVSSHVAVAVLDHAATITTDGLSAGIACGLLLIGVDLFVVVLSGMFRDTLLLLKTWREKRKAKKDAEKEGGEG